MEELVKASVGTMHGAGAMVLALGLVGATRQGVRQGPGAAQAASVRAALATLTVLVLASLMQTLSAPGPTAWTQFGLLLALRVGLKRLFANELNRIE